MTDNAQMMRADLALIETVRAQADERMAYPERTYLPCSEDLALATYAMVREMWDWHRAGTTVRGLPSPAAPQVADGPLSDIIRRFDALVACVRSKGRVPQSAAISWGVDSLTYGDLIGLRNWAARTQDAEHDAGSLRVQMSHVCKELDSAREAERGAKARADALDARVTEIMEERDDCERSRRAMHGELERLKAIIAMPPTPAAPCGSDADAAFEAWVARDIRDVDDISHKDAFDAGYAAALALAETKAVEMRAEPDYSRELTNAIQDAIRARFGRGTDGHCFYPGLADLKWTLWGYERATGIRLPDFVAKAVES